MPREAPNIKKSRRRTEFILFYLVARSEMRAAAGVADAKEVGPLVRGQGLKTANLLDERPVALGS
jgi:hypothetical protein